MKQWLHISPAATILAAAGGGWLFQLGGLPLPWLLGPMLAVALLGLSGIRFAGQEPRFPVGLRAVFVPVIGVMVGSSFTPSVLVALPSWWPSLLALLPFALAVQFANYAMFRVVAKYDKATAFFSASPGGLVESVLVGERQGGDVGLMATQHFARIALAVAIVPTLFTILTGHAVGSAAGVSLQSTHGQVDPLDYALLAGAAAIGYVLGTRLKLPAGIMVGPMILSAILHGTGVTSALVPQLLVIAAQLVVGAGLGIWFVGRHWWSIAKGLGYALIAVIISLLLAFLCVEALAPINVAPPEAVFLAFAPGGVAEMGLVAISLGASPVFVALHHVVRILITVLAAPAVFARLVARKGAGGGK